MIEDAEAKASGAVAAEISDVISLRHTLEKKTNTESFDDLSEEEKASMPNWAKAIIA